MKEAKKIYLSGPISGRRDRDVVKHFNRVKWLLEYEAEAAGTPVLIISPATLSIMGLEWDSYMKIARAIIEDPSIDAICMMKGWEKSDGCKREAMWAAAAGKTFIREPGAAET